MGELDCALGARYCGDLVDCSGGQVARLRNSSGSLAIFAEICRARRAFSCLTGNMFDREGVAPDGGCRGMGYPRPLARPATEIPTSC